MMNRYKRKIGMLLFALTLTLSLPIAGWTEDDFTFNDVFVTRNSTDRLQFHGYVSFEYADAQGAAPGGNRTFDATVFEPFFGYQVADKVFAKIIIEFEHAPEKTSGDSVEVSVEQAEIDITPLAGTNLAFGAILVPFGLENYFHSPSDNRMISRPPLANEGPNGNTILNNTWTEAGIQVTQEIPKIGILDLYTINGSAVQNEDNRGRDTTGPNANSGKSFGAEVQVTKLYPGVNVGASYITGPYDPNNHLNSSRWGVHALVNIGMIYFQGEYLGGTDEGLGASGGDRDMSGYYALISFTPPIQLLEDRLDLNIRQTDWTADKSAKNDFAETAFGVRYRPYQNTWVKAEYQINKEKGSNTNVHNNVAALQLSVLF